MSGVSKATTRMFDFQGHDVTSKLRLNPKDAQGSPPEVVLPNNRSQELCLGKKYIEFR